MEVDESAIDVASALFRLYDVRSAAQGSGHQNRQAVAQSVEGGSPVHSFAGIKAHRRERVQPGQPSDIGAICADEFIARVDDGPSGALCAIGEEMLDMRAPRAHVREGEPFGVVSVAPESTKIVLSPSIARQRSLPFLKACARAISMRPRARR